MNSTAKNSVPHPPLSYFDQSFADNPCDVLFCALNDIDPIFAQEKFNDKESYLPQQTLDPRNKQPIIESFYDHTIHHHPEIFRCPNRSALTRAEHILCLSFLQSIKAQQEVFPHQIACFDNTFGRRQKEQAAFMEFLRHFNNASYEKIYAPNLMLLGLYAKFYDQEVKHLMGRYTDGIFQIHTGFPIPQKCGNLDKLGSISDVEFLNEDHRSNVVRPPIDRGVDFSVIKPKLEAFFDLALRRSSVDQDEQTFEQPEQFHISLDSLVFLMSAGEYIDIPSDALVEVIEGLDGENVILINDLLPSRNTGPHTAELVTSFCTEVFLKSKTEDSPSEIQATDFKGAYQLHEFDEFLIRQTTSQPLPPVAVSYVKWNLNLENDSKQIQIISRTSSNQRMLHSVKLEFKPQFGCEIMTKVSLLREWFQLKFFESSQSLLSRHRINAGSFKTVLHENLDLEQIENELERRYKVKTGRLLGALGDFLGLLSNIGPGRYLLRFNPRFQDKLMLYSETPESTSKSSVSLHNLLRESPSDLAFMTLRQLTPIDETLCTEMHSYHNMLPCSFPIGLTKAKRTRRIIDDRKFIQKKAKMKTDLIEAKKKKQKQRRNTTKRTKRAKKLKQKNKVVQEQQKETTELEDEIKKDRILFGFD